MSGPLRLADLLASLSLVTDLGFGLPAEEAMRSCIIATALAREMDLPDGQISDVFYSALLEHVGCTGFAHETALTYGDELTMNAAGWAERSGDRSPATASSGAFQSRRRSPALHFSTHGRAPCPAHLREDRRLEQGRRGAVRYGA